MYFPFLSSFSFPLFWEVIIIIIIKHFLKSTFPIVRLERNWRKKKKKERPQKHRSSPYLFRRKHPLFLPPSPSPSLYMLLFDVNRKSIACKWDRQYKIRDEVVGRKTQYCWKRGKRGRVLDRARHTHNVGGGWGALFGEK